MRDVFAGTEAIIGNKTIGWITQVAINTRSLAIGVIAGSSIAEPCNSGTINSTLEKKKEKNKEKETH